MAPEALQCPKCLAWLQPEVRDQPAGCQSCGAPIDAHVFPALGRPLAGATRAESVAGEGEANCFYHAANRAAAVCDACGRFLCALCDIELGGRHVCPACLSAGPESGRVGDLVSSRPVWGQIALLTALLPILFYPFLVVTAPAAVFLGVYGWSKPGSLVRRGKTRHVLAIVIGLAEIAAIIAFAVVIWRGITSGG